jgi:CheY-like chemotaxis protein
MPVPTNCSQPRAIILIVDDAQDTRDIYAEALESQGYLVEVAECGETAVLAACVNRPTLIVMDLTMPGLDGFIAIRAIRALPELDSVYITVVSGSDDEETRERARAAGGDAFFPKPFLPVDLIHHVNSTLASGAAPRQLPVRT